MSRTMLSASSLVTAKQFIFAHARGLERARASHAFDGAPVAAVFEALGGFQNADGGFGHAIEPDVRTPHSSVIGTTVAFQGLRWAHATSHNELARAGISYLLANYNKASNHWRIVPRSAQDAPHAPWWDQVGREDSFDTFSLNPTAEILGYLWEHRTLVPQDVIDAVSARVIGAVDAAEEIEMHELMCLLRLAATPGLPPDIASPIQAKVADDVSATVTTDPDAWSGYNLRPLQVVDAPSSPFMANLEAAVEANLDFEIAAQSIDGSWQPTWSWADTDPLAWAEAEREWSGVITLDKLLLLQRFDRVEGIGSPHTT